MALTGVESIISSALTPSMGRTRRRVASRQFTYPNLLPYPHQWQAVVSPAAPARTPAPTRVGVTTAFVVDWSIIPYRSRRWDCLRGISKGTWRRIFKVNRISSASLCVVFHFKSLFLKHPLFCTKFCSWRTDRLRIQSTYKVFLENYPK